MSKKRSKSLSADTILMVEDSLQEASVFVNGLRGTPAHSDSYMTVVDYEKLTEWRNQNQFDAETLAFCINYWKTNPNMQPPLRLVALSLERTI